MTLVRSVHPDHEWCAQPGDPPASKQGGVEALLRGPRTMMLQAAAGELLDCCNSAQGRQCGHLSQPVCAREARQRACSCCLAPSTGRALLVKREASAPAPARERRPYASRANVTATTATSNTSRCIDPARFALHLLAAAACRGPSSSWHIWSCVCCSHQASARRFSAGLGTAGGSEAACLLPCTVLFQRLALRWLVLHVWLLAYAIEFW